MTKKDATLNKKHVMLGQREPTNPSETIKNGKKSNAE